MERNRSSWHGGNYRGESANVPAPRQPSQPSHQTQPSRISGPLAQVAETGDDPVSVERASKNPVPVTWETEWKLSREDGSFRQPNNAHERNNRSQSASLQIQSRPSQARTSSPAHDIDDRPSRFLRQYSIREKIHKSTYNRGINGKDFVSHASLRGIWRYHLKEFLGVLSNTLIEDDLEYIWTNFLRILSILVLIRWKEWHRFSQVFLDSMRDPQCSRLDESIPFSLAKLSDESFLGDMGDDFNLRQYAFHPIIIEGGTAKEYPSWKRMPFILSESEKLGEGNFGTVMKEAIPPFQFKLKHSGNPDAKKIYVARKRMKVQSDFKKEKENLVELNSSLSKHGHIVRYIAIIIVGDKDSAKDFSILMPLASMNLQTFLYKEDSLLPEFQVKHLIEQAANIADAIKWLHEGQPISGRRLVCCHMDLKLDNILVYLDQDGKDEPVGKWKISDFGISTLKEPDEQRARPRTEERRRSDALSVESPAQTLARLTARIPAARAPAAFQAPEVSRGSEIGRSSDVWSFGCILFQILARGVGPSTTKLLELDRLRAYEKDKITRHPTDYFYHEQGPEKYLNPHVKQWLSESLRDGSFIDRHFVDKCRVVVLGILKINPPDRLKAYQVNDRLWHILKGPDAAPFSAVHRRSTNPQRPSLTVPGISVTPVPDQAIPAVIRQANFTTSAPVNSPSEFWDPMVVLSIDPPPGISHRTARAVAGDIDNRSSIFPTIPSNITISGQYGNGNRQVSPNFNASTGSTSGLSTNPNDTATAGRGRRQVSPEFSVPNEPPVGQLLSGNRNRQEPTHYFNVSTMPPVGQLPSRHQNQHEPTRFQGTTSARTSHNVSSQSQPSNQGFQTSPPEVSSNPGSSPTDPDGGASMSHSSNRSNSLASSIESRVSIEAIPFDIKSFMKLKDAVMQAMISPMSGNIAFITKKAISIRTTSSPANYLTFGTDSFEWECGGMAGDWLVAVGYYTVAKSSRERALRLYKVSTNGVLEPPHSYRVFDQPPHVDHAVVSWEGRLIFQDRACAWLYSYHNDRAKKRLTQFGNPEGISFGNSGVYAFVITTIGTNHFRIGVWDVSDPQRLVTHYDYKRERSDLVAESPSIIPFPSSPFCILWDVSGKLWFLRQRGQAAQQFTAQLESLQAVAISPDEKFAIFVRSIKHKSRISISRIDLENNMFTIKEKDSGIELRQSLSHHKKSAVEVQATESQLRIIIAHSDGSHEITKDISTLELL